jgi:hypothetical protein
MARIIGAGSLDGLSSPRNPPPSNRFFLCVGNGLRRFARDDDATVLHR